MRGIRIGDEIRWSNDTTVYTIADMRRGSSDHPHSSGELLFVWSASSNGVWSYSEEGFNREIRDGGVIILSLAISPLKFIKKHEFTCY